MYQIQDLVSESANFGLCRIEPYACPMHVNVMTPPTITGRFTSDILPSLNDEVQSTLSAASVTVIITN